MWSGRDGEDEDEEDLRDDLSGLPLARIVEEVPVVVRGTPTGRPEVGKGTVTDSEVPWSSSSSELLASLNMASA